MSGYIAIHRKLLDWEWYNDINTKVLFLHCLLKANWQDREWKSTTILRGSFVTSVDNLSKETGLTVKQTRLSLDKLNRTSNITIKTTNKYSLITVVKYDDYQNIESAKGKQKGKQTDTQRATTNNINNNSNLSVNWDSLLKQFNEATNKESKVIPDKAKKQIVARLKDGYTKQEIYEAILNCYRDPFHVETGHKYLTLEFISRPDKLEKYVSVKQGFTKPKVKEDKL